jgi:hypothetical protein
MRTKLRIAALVFAAAALSAAGSAQAAFIAGWDFTQYAGAASLVVTDEGDTADTLRANYSDYDPTFGAGGASQPFGTMWMNGQHGSTNVDENAAQPIFLPTTGSLTPSLGLPGLNETPVGDVPFDASTGVLEVAAGNYLAGLGQDFRNVLSMRALQDVQVVFEANLAAVSALHVAENWSITFDGITNTGTSSVTIEFSTDGISYSALTPASLTTTGTAFTASVVGNPGDNAYFRLGFDGTGGGSATPRIDNVSISGDVTVIPEPGTAALLLIGLMGLGAAGRRRAA